MSENIYIGYIIVAILDLIVGFIIGMIVQSKKFSHDLQLDKIRRLTPHMEKIHPICETLITNIEHAIALLDSSDQEEFNRYLERTQNGLYDYGVWFESLSSEGLKPELQSLDYNLYASLYGIFVYYKMAKNEGRLFLQQQMKTVTKDLKRTQRYLENFLKQ